MDINTAIHEAFIIESNEMEMEFILEYATTEERDAVYEAVRKADDYEVEKFEDVYGSDDDERDTRCIIINSFSNLNASSAAEEIENYCENISGIACDECEVEETGYWV